MYIYIHTHKIYMLLTLQQNISATNNILFPASNGCLENERNHRIILDL